MSKTKTLNHIPNVSQINIQFTTTTHCSENTFPVVTQPNYVDSLKLTGKQCWAIHSFHICTISETLSPPRLLRNLRTICSWKQFFPLHLCKWTAEVFTIRSYF